MVDALIRVRLADGRTEAMSLPEVYAAMVAERVIGFPALRCHQRHAWHALLAQLGVIAMHRAGRAVVPGEADEWRALLRGLTPGGDEPWCLVVSDVEKPAFLQCPAPEGLGAYRGARQTTPDDLDLLVTSKNHEQKMSVAVRSAPDDWVFALASLQTMAGSMGRYSPIARMNGGFGSRVCVGLAPADGGVGAHLVRDVRGMLDVRDELVESYGFEEDGLALLWTEPWDGESALGLRQLDPYFVEVCRRVRLLEGPVALLASSTCARIDAGGMQGDVGDYWTPVNVKKGNALTVSVEGFTYDRLLALFFGGTYRLPPSMYVDAKASRWWRLVARGVAGGRGKTAGYHERDIVMGAETVGAVLEGSAELRELADRQMEEIGEFRSALVFAVEVAGGRVERYARQLDGVVDRLFFEALDARYRGRQQHLVQRLRDATVRLLEEATSPARSEPKLRAWRAFWAAMRVSEVSGE